MNEINSIMLSAAKAQTPSPPPLPKRFYKAATHIDGLLLLDGRSAKTPAKHQLHAPLKAADALCAEWNAQTDVLDPKKMPLTRILNSIIDGVENNKHEVIAEILKFAGSDLICYRAQDPEKLVELENNHWNEIITRFKLEFKLAHGIQYVEQPQATLKALEAFIPQEKFALGAVHVLTTLTGSALIALALSAKLILAKEGWLAAHVDEDFQISEWGDDDEAIERRNARFKDYEAAILLL